ncbi:uncharacterized protein LOC107041184 [Diachasma alloeum]|uniref:uncharacterized protein LOC107041184 n=1 Tax=Diachasma alloeum TaxID=454923 RepID=UPI000738198C|nr:uncharacterized protein LOC107041184 [Diachasma alloeum]
MGQTSSGADPGTTRDTTSHCSFCENPSCYEEIPPTSPGAPEEALPPDRNRSLNELARKFDSILDKAKTLGLQELVKPIEETAITLKNLAEPGQSLALSEPGLSCDCNQWGPDVVSPQGKWICNPCGDKCQCDKTWYIPSVSKKISHMCDPEPLKEKGFHEETDTSIARIRGQSEETAANDESFEIQIKVSADHLLSAPPKYPLEPSPRREGVEEGESGATCPCGCGYFQQGEFKVCPCGCGTIIEIVDDAGEYLGVRDGGPCCVCGNELNDEPIHNPEQSSKVSFVPSDTGLMSALEMLQAKCRIKDGMIAVLAEELRNSGHVNHIVENLGAPCLPRIAIDFDRSMLCDYLRSTSLPDLSQRRTYVEDDAVPKPTNFRVVRSILNSLFVAWDPPESLCKLRGFEITVNGIVTSRVGSPTRTQAILTSVDMTKPTVLTLYAVATNGHISDSSTITFPASKYP